jgi:hypothetical protein
MFFGVRGWRCSNKTKYIGSCKVGGSIRGGGEFYLGTGWGLECLLVFCWIMTARKEGGGHPSMHPMQVYTYGIHRP